jgi:hypothetical protein
MISKETSIGDGLYEVEYVECSRCYGSGYAHPEKYITVTKVDERTIFGSGFDDVPAGVEGDPERFEEDE